MAGTWVFEDPLTSPLLLFLIQLALTLVVTRILGKIVSYIKQPQVIGEIIAGVILGPSLLGRIDGYADSIWPTAVSLGKGKVYNSLITFSVVANVGLIFFMFLMGMELDRSLLRRKWKFSVPIAASAILFPFGVGVATAFWLYDVNSEGSVPNWGPSKTAFTLFAGASMSFTAFPVLAAILRSTNLLNSEVGLQAMSCAALDDIMAWSTLAIASSFSKSGSAVNGLYTCVLAVLYVGVMTAVVKPALEHTHAWATRRKLQDSRYYLCFIFLLVIASAFTTEVIGIHAFFGAFLMGLVTPKTEDFADDLFDRMKLVIMEVLLPLYFANSGINTNIGTLSTARYWGMAVALIVTACFAKFTPACFTCKLLTGQSWRFSATLGVLMNTRGMVEVIALNVGLSLGILSQRTFTMLILMAIVTTMMTSPLVWFLHIRPTDRETARQAELEAVAIAPSDAQDGGDNHAVAIAPRDAQDGGDNHNTTSPVK